MSRDLKLVLEKKSGQIHDFEAIVGNRVVISGNGTKKRKYSGKVSDATVQARVRVVGIPGSQYTVSVDLPGKANDFVWKYTLVTSMQGVDFEL